MSLENDRLSQFAHELSQVRVLDPACGSGNFLYVALRRLLDLQKEVITHAARRGLPDIPLTVGPHQLYGIEINEYAHELAQVTVWIGYLQWRHENGFAEMDDPVLRPLGNIRHMDAILAHDADGHPVEPEWPAAEVIIGNPPFLGGKRLRSELGDAYVDDVFRVYDGRVPREADLVCYWFEKAREAIKIDYAKRAGLLATNSIRGGANRKVLDRIKDTGDIFMAWSDNSWILDGAAVRVSIIGFAGKSETNATKTLDGLNVSIINSDLSSTINVSEAKQLTENQHLSFMGVTPAGPFDIDGSLARKWIAESENNQKVVRPYYNGTDITRRPRDVWIVDFGVDMSIEDAGKYEAPFSYVQNNVYPIRKDNSRASYRDKWWLHAEARSGMRSALKPLSRYIGTSMVAKHRIFDWLEPEILPANLVIAIARDDDYFFGVLHSRLHELWALRMGTSLEDRPRYTPTTTFETFPFPWPPGAEGEQGSRGEGEQGSRGAGEQGGEESGQGREAEDRRRLVEAIARRARELVAWRAAWLNPPPPAKGTLDVAYDRLIKARTLTNLYNGLVYYRDHKGTAFDRAAFDKETRGGVSREEIRELDDIHRALDAAVLRAYGWPDGLSDEAILERLLDLNLMRGRRGENPQITQISQIEE